jgi:phytoene synthase
MTTATDRDACRQLLRGGSRTFFAASYLLPAAVRRSATALYAFCRLTDDAIDHATDPHAALDRVRERLERIYAGRPWPDAADRAFAAVVASHAIPRALPEALVEGFAWDAQGRRYDDLPSLHDYAARVAGTVGAMMAMLMGARDGAVVARACDLGVAMQLSNIARDVGEDARAGRLYLPRHWLAEAGIDADAWLARPAPSAGLATVIARLLTCADELYQRVDAGIAALPAACRPGIRAAGLLYADIGHEVRRRGFDAVTQRAVVPGRRKAVLLSRALLAPTAAGAARHAPTLPAVRFLVDAVVAAPLPAPTPSAAVTSGVPPWWRFGQRLLWFAALAERLARREELARQGLRA